MTRDIDKRAYSHTLQMELPDDRVDHPGSRESVSIVLSLYVALGHLGRMLLWSGGGA